MTLAPAFTDDAATERLYVATGATGGVGVGVSAGVGVTGRVGVGVSDGAEDGVEAATVTVMMLDRATSVYPSFCRKRNSYVPGVGGAGVVNVPALRPPVYTHLPKLLLGSPTLYSPTQSLAKLPEGAAQVAVTLAPALTDVGVANTI